MVGEIEIANAAKLKELDLVRELLKNSDNYIQNMALEATDDQYKGTTLYWSCVHGDVELVQKLLLLGADINAVNSYGHTPLHAAVDMGHHQVVQLLLKNKSRIDVQNQSGQAPLHLAAYRGFGDIVETLILAGANPSIRNHRNMTPQQVAVCAKHDGVAKTFQKYGKSQKGIALQLLTRKTKSEFSRSAVSLPSMCSCASMGRQSYRRQTIPLQSNIHYPQIHYLPIAQPVYVYRVMTNISLAAIANPDLPPPYSSLPPEYTSIPHQSPLQTSPQIS